MKETQIIRNELNRLAELSGQEFRTSDYIYNYLKKLNPSLLDKIPHSTSVIGVFDRQIPGKTIALRADIDALPTSEGKYRHLCGHDGHSAIFLSLAEMISKQNHPGKIIFIFQSAEETGKGAEEIVNSSLYKELKPDFIFGFHNLPGFRENQICLSKNLFASASAGLLIKLTGLDSHASEPEKGINPAQAIGSCVTMLSQLAKSMDGLGFCLATIVHIRLGDQNFGINPGNGEIGVTLRSYRQSDLNLMLQRAIENCRKIAEWYKLDFSFEICDPFPSTVNIMGVVEQLEWICQEYNFDYQYLEQPFRWSEDFGHYLLHTPGAFLGIGAGLNQKPLHNPEYHFNDNINETALNLFSYIIDLFSSQD